MNVAKLHHINPQFVLRGFADEDRITTIRLTERKARTTRVRETAAENHLYSIPGHPSGSDVFEKGLGSGIEADASAIFDRVKCGEWPLPPDDRNTLAEFVALQVLRGPERRRQMESAAAELFSKTAGQLGRDGMVQWVSDGIRRSLDEAEVDELWAIVTNPGSAPIPYTARDHIEMMAGVTESIAAVLTARPWTLVRFTQHALITSDAPVTSVPYKDSGPFTGMAYAQLVLYPMTRRTGLIMRDPFDGSTPGADLADVIERARSGALDDESVGTAAAEKKLNGFTARHAVNNLYHHPADSDFVPPEYRAE